MAFTSPILLLLLLTTKGDMPPWRRRRKEATPHCYLGVANEAMKLRAAPGAQRVGKTFERGGTAGYRGKNTPRGWRQNAKEIRFWLAFEYEGGGSGGSSFETAEKSSSSSHLDAREVVVPDMLKRQKGPPPARVWMQGRWKQWKQH